MRELLLGDTADTKVPDMRTLGPSTPGGFIILTVEGEQLEPSTTAAEERGLRAQ